MTTQPNPVEKAIREIADAYRRSVGPERFRDACRPILAALVATVREEERQRRERLEKVALDLSQVFPSVDDTPGTQQKLWVLQPQACAALSPTPKPERPLDPDTAKDIRCAEIWGEIVREARRLCQAFQMAQTVGEENRQFISKQIAQKEAMDALRYRVAQLDVLESTAQNEKTVENER